MKRYLLILALLCAVHTYGQETLKRTIAPPDEKTIVKDGSGAILPYATWTKMLKSGWFSLKLNRETDEFYIYEMSPEQRAILEEKRKASLSTRPKPKESPAFNEGDKFRGDKITDVSGNKFDVRKPDGKVYVFNYWFINCPPCKKEIPELNRLVAKFKGNPNVVFLAIAPDDAYSLKGFLKTTPFQYNVVDDGRYYNNKFDVKAFPTHVIVGKDGIIKFSAQGYSSNLTYWLEKTIEEQLAAI